MKTHLNFATTDLDRSIGFYSVLLDARPVKAFDDYALFVVDQPGLELALHRAEASSAASGTHYGIAVESLEKLERAIARFEAAGLQTAIERQQTCCYANQSKVWVSDPSGRPWEIYVVHAESAERDSGDSCCAA